VAGKNNKKKLQFANQLNGSGGMFIRVGEIPRENG